MSQQVSQETKKMSSSSSMKMTSSSSSSTTVKKVMSSSSAQAVSESQSSNGQSSMTSQSSSSFQASQAMSSGGATEMLEGAGASMLPTSGDLSEMMSSATDGMSKMMSSSSTMQSSSSSMKSVMKSSSSKLSAINVTSGGGSFLDSVSPDITKGLGLNMDKLFTDMDSEMQKLRSQLHLSPLAKLGDADELIKLDAKSLEEYVDDIEKDKYKFNFDVHEFQSESVNVKADGNKIEVHGKKMVKKDGDEQTEEYSKVYELPEKVDPKLVSSSMYKDGVLTVELPVEKPVETHTVEATITLDG